MMRILFTVGLPQAVLRKSVGVLMQGRPLNIFKIGCLNNQNTVSLLLGGFLAGVSHWPH